MTEKEYTSNLKLNKLLDKIENQAKDLFNKALLEKRKLTESEIESLFFNSIELKKSDNSFFVRFDEFINKDFTFKCYPSPANDYVIIHLNPIKKQKIVINIFDIKGQKINSLYYSNLDSEQKFYWDLRKSNG